MVKPHGLSFLFFLHEVRHSRVRLQGWEDSLRKEEVWGGEAAGKDCTGKQLWDWPRPRPKVCAALLPAPPVE